MTKPHKHAEVIKAWADGAEIEIRDIFGKWTETKPTPQWHHESEYRVKLAPQYPVTRMDGIELRSLFADARQEMLSPCVAVANAAIARAFIDGDAVLPSEVDRMVAEGIAKGRAARDLAVAEAVSKAIILAWGRLPYTEQSEAESSSMAAVNLTAIIATIKE